MKTTDIKVGGEYAQKRSKYGRANRVKVIEKGVEYQPRRWSEPTRSGVMIEWVGTDLSPTVVPSREIIEPWHVHAEREAEAARAAAQRQEDMQREVRHRARLAKRIEDRIDGEALHRPYFYRADERDALLAAGFERDDRGFITRQAGLGDLMRYGRVSIEIVEQLL